MVAVNIKPPDAEPGIDQAALYAKLGYQDHSDAQHEYSFSQARFNVPCCGRRWGKSIATGHRMTYKSFAPESYNWIVGPTYKLGEKEFRVVAADYDKLGLTKYCRKSYSPKSGNMVIKTPWKSIIEVVSAEKPDSLLGEGLSHAVMSEAAKHSRQIWEQYIEPALSDLLGSADFPSTPQGFNWYHGLFTLGQDTSMPQYKSYWFPTWTNPVRYPGGINNGELVRIRAVVSKAYWEQEYGALFTSMQGAIYDEWDDRANILKHTFRADWNNYASFDFGFANPFVMLDIQVSPSEDVFVWREYYERYKSTYDHGQYLAKERPNPDNYHIDGMWGDPRGADAIATLSNILGFVASQDVPWKHGIEAIKRLIKKDQGGQPKLYVDPSCTNLTRQMQQLHVKEPSRAQKLDINENVGDGNIQHKVDDHAADALRYFVGPYFVLGAGQHLEDIYGSNYAGSESESFFQLHSQATLNGIVNSGQDEWF